MSFVFLVLFIVGCTNQADVSTSSSEIDNKLIKLEQKIETLQASIEEHEDQLNGMKDLKIELDMI